MTFSQTALFSKLFGVLFSVSSFETFPAPVERSLEANSSRDSILTYSDTHHFAYNIYKGEEGNREDHGFKKSKAKMGVSRFRKKRKKKEFQWVPPNVKERTHRRVMEERWNRRRVSVIAEEDLAVVLNLPSPNIEPRAGVNIEAESIPFPSSFSKDDGTYGNRDNYQRLVGVNPLSLRGIVNKREGRREAKLTNLRASGKYFLYPSPNLHLPSNTPKQSFSSHLSPSIPEPKSLPKQSPIFHISSTLRTHKKKPKQNPSSHSPLALPFPKILTKHSLHQTNRNLIDMDINALAETVGRLSTERSKPSSSGGRGDRPKLTINAGRGISMLLGKMLSENKVALAKAAGAARYAWGEYGEIGVQPTQSQNLFIFTFKDAKTRERIWLERPWSLSNTMTAVEKCEGRGEPKDVPMNKLAVCVQIHGLHQNQRSEQNIISIGTFYFKKFIDMDRASIHFNGYRRFVTMLAEVDLCEPVLTGFNFPSTDEATGRDYCEVISFKYERLVELCYFCGRIGHNWPTCSRMKEERKKGGYVQLSEIYTSELKVGIDSPYRSRGSRGRTEEEEPRYHSSDPDSWRKHYSSGDSYFCRVETEGVELTKTGEVGGNHPVIPPGFTIRQFEEEAREEERNNVGRLKRRYTEEMGAMDLTVDMESVAAMLQGRLRIEGEEGSRSQMDRRYQMGSQLSLGPSFPNFQAQWNTNLEPNQTNLHIQSPYQHNQEELEGEVGRTLKKRKGLSFISPRGAEHGFNEGVCLNLSPTNSGFAEGVSGRGKKKKQHKFKAHKTNGGIREEEESVTTAAVVRHKPHHIP
ncbi:unnamed protein product [Linum trigynum]|uniref:Zinc knuckle CX2CX4HX4C domain-containing protein n=1 Tax=Linum trigynum TaxID=586398 RepID=A0AAV2CJ60_9ROSI